MNNLVNDYIETKNNKLVVGMLKGKRVFEIKAKDGLLICGNTAIEYDSKISVQKNIDKLCNRAVKELMQSRVKVLSYSIL